jgi:peptidoglycan-associated lipoprotein
MRETRKRLGWLLILGIGTLLYGCSSSGQSGRLDHLESKLSDQESRLTRLSQTVSAGETKQKYLAEQIELMSGRPGSSGRMGELANAEVYFGFNEFDLSPEAKRSLDRLAGALAEDPNAIIELRGHTDAVGSRQYNYQLGEMRAESVGRYLHRQFQVPLYRMTRVSYGEDALAKPTSETEREKANRRVEVRIMSNQAPGGTDLP